MIRREIWILVAVVAALLACSEKKGPVKPAPCECGHQGELSGDSIFDVRDVLHIKNIVFHDSADIVDHDCPHVGRADVNCDCVVDSIDVIYLMGFVFRNGQPPCNPCDSGMGCPRAMEAAGPPLPSDNEGRIQLVLTEDKGLEAPCPGCPVDPLRASGGIDKLEMKSYHAEAQRTPEPCLDRLGHGRLA